jgi:membrane protease YdiL (CAAX protease family)
MYEVRDVGKRIFRGPITSLSLGLVLFIAQAWVLINYSGPGFSREVGMIYLILVFGFLIYTYYRRNTQNVVYRETIWHSLKSGLLGFLLTWAIVFPLYMAIGIEFGSTASPAVIGVVLTQLLFVAPSEEIMFRSVLPDVLESRMRWTWGALVVSQGAFALFHWSAYGGDWGAMALAFFIGMIWVLAYRFKPFFMREKLGIGFTTGSHCAYNLILSGILIGNITMICGGI